MAGQLKALGIQLKPNPMSGATLEANSTVQHSGTMTFFEITLLSRKRITLKASNTGQLGRLKVDINPKTTVDTVPTPFTSLSEIHAKLEFADRPQIYEIRI